MKLVGRRQALVSEDRTDDQRRESAARHVAPRDRSLQLLQVGFTERRLADALPDRPVRLRKRESLGVAGWRRRRPDAGQGSHQLAVAVVGGVGTDDAAPAGGEPRHPKRDFVGLCAAAAQHDALDLWPMQGGEALGEADDPLVQVAAVDVQGRLLPRHRVHDPGIGVTDAGDVIVHIHIPPPVGVEQIGAFPPHDVQRRLVEERGPGPQRLVAPGLEGGDVAHDRAL